MHAQRLSANVGFGVMISLLLLSIFTFHQRAYFSDFNFINFLIANAESVQIQEMRWGSFITHLFPLFALKFGAGYEQMLWWYNLSFFTFFTITYAILLFRWKCYELCILLIAYFLFFQGDTFFWLNNEVHQGVCWAFLGLGYFQHKEIQGKSNITTYLISFLLILLGILTHMLVIIPVFFLVVFYLLYNSNENFKKVRRNDLLLLAFIFISIGLKFIFKPSGQYDDVKLAPIIHFKITNLVNALNDSHAIYLYKQLVSNYLLISITIVFSIFLLIKKRKFLLLSSFVLCVIMYFMLILLVYPTTSGREMDFYIQSEYMIISIVIMLPIVYFTNEIKRLNNASLLLIILFSLQFIYKFYGSYQYFDTRLKNVNSIIEFCNKKNITKGLVIVDKSIINEYFIMDWGLPVETLSFSHNYSEKEITVKSITPEEKEKFTFSLNNTDTFLHCFKSLPIDSCVSSVFFDLESNSSYEILPTEELLSQLIKLPN